MRNFNQDNRRSGRRDFDRRDSGRRTMHQAVCDECGKDCEVPFRPSGDRPIYCSSCFENKGGRSDNSRRSGSDYSRRKSFDNRGARDDSRRSGNDNNKQFDIINAKLDRILEKLSPVALKKSVSKKDLAKKKKGKKPKKEIKKAKAKKD